MRAVRWLVVAAVVVYGAGIVGAQLTRHEVPLWYVMAPWAIFAVLAVLRVVREARRSGAAAGVRRTVGPPLQGLEEIQAIQLGRPPGLVVTYGPDEPQASELVEPHPDGLDEGPWTLRPSADGGVEVETGDGPGA